MAVKSKPQSVENTATRRKLARSSQPAKGRKKPAKDVVTNAIPQKALVYAARLGDPPAISDDVPDEMPFSTDGQ